MRRQKNLLEVEEELNLNSTSEELLRRSNLPSTSPLPKSLLNLCRNLAPSYSKKKSYSRRGRRSSLNQEGPPSVEKKNFSQPRRSPGFSCLSTEEEDFLFRGLVLGGSGAEHADDGVGVEELAVLAQAEHLEGLLSLSSGELVTEGHEHGSEGVGFDLAGVLLEGTDGGHDDVVIV